MAADTQLLVPIAGFCVKTYKTSAAAYEASGKVFVNVCANEFVERAQGSTGLLATDEHLDNRGLSNLQIPVLVGPSRKMVDSHGHPAIVVDVIFHPSLVTRAFSGTPQFSAEHFRGYLIDLALKNVADDLNIKIERFKVQVLEKVKYKGSVPGENSNNTRSFEVISKEPRKAEPKAEPGKPKIEVIGEMKPKTHKPIIRKGFFDKPNVLDDEEKELYPDGSAEGIMAPGQGDAINFIDPKLKDTCHIIDPSQMSQDAMQAAMESYARTGRLDGSLKGVYAKGQSKDLKPEVGLGHPSAWRDSAKTDAGDNNKEGSNNSNSNNADSGKGGMSKKSTRDQEKPAKPIGDSLFKFIGELEEPKYRMEETAVGGSLALAIFVDLPRIESMRALHLDVTEKQLQVRGAGYRLKLDLPKLIDMNNVKAKFTTKKKELRITAPIVDLE